MSYSHIWVCIPDTPCLPACPRNCSSTFQTAPHSTLAPVWPCFKVARSNRESSRMNSPLYFVCLVYLFSAFNALVSTYRNSSSNLSSLIMNTFSKETWVPYSPNTLVTKRRQEIHFLLLNLLDAHTDTHAIYITYTQTHIGTHMHGHIHKHACRNITHTCAHTHII